MADRLTRIAIVSSDRCKPKKCRQECKKSCPVVKTVHMYLQVNCALRSLLHLKLLSSLRSCALVAVSVLRNAHLKQFKLSIYQKIWIKIRPTDMAPIPLNCTGYQYRGRDKFLVWLEQMALGSRLPLKFWLGN
ncbi:hypothetical protein CsSME_00027740 [Camellia sinensis var. sinensis]